MELVYLWVEDYKNIQKQGFNFSPRFTCKYDSDNNELTIDENKDYIENFFDDNINVTAIVGKNGSGKSNILNVIINASEDDGTSEKYILVYSNEGKEYYHSNFELETSLNKRNDAEFIIYLDRKNNDNLPINIDATPLTKVTTNPWIKFREIDI